jgi:hypothetical protein
MHLTAYEQRKRLTRSRLNRLAIALPIVVSGVAASTFAFLSPSSASKDSQARVFAEGLRIELDRGSPAYAALEDAWLDLDSDQSEALPQATAEFRLAAEERAETDSTQLAQKILRENRREQALISQERNARELQAQVLAQAASEALKKFAEKYHVDSETNRRLQAEAANAEDSADVIEHPMQTISLSDLQISREELLGSLFFPIVAANSEESKPRKASAGTMLAAGPTQSSRRAASRTYEASESSLDPSLVNEQARRTPVRPKPEGHPEAYRQVILTGDLEFTGGLAIANSMDRLVVFREKDGEVLESGAIWLREGRYEIYVEETEGDLVGELRTPYGDILGRGILDLSQVTADGPNPRRIERVGLKISAVTQGVAGRVIANRPDGVPAKPVPDTNVLFKNLPLDSVTNKEGIFVESNLLEGSTAIVKATKTGYWSTMKFARAGSSAEIEMFPNLQGDMVDRLVKFAKANQLSADQASIIWGRVTRSGKPVEGASVDLMTTQEPVAPVYFNEAMMPDAKLSATSSNGLYAFFPISPGAHAVQATINHQPTEPLVFPTEERTVSRVDIETVTDRKARVKVFDAFRTDWPLAAEVRDPSHTRRVSVERSGETSITFADGQGVLVLDADAGRGYERVRLTLGRDRRAIYFPMVQSRWLDGIKGSLKLSQVPYAGTMVGFVQGSQPYRVSLEDKSVSEGVRTVYFNNRGEVTGSDFGQPGGGFILFNVKEGFRTVSVQPSGTQKVFAATALVESGATNVLSHWLR